MRSYLSYLAGVPLTPAERRVAAVAARGISLHAAAKELGLTPGSVKVYLAQRVYPKLRLHSQPELVRYWMEHEEGRGDCSTCLLRVCHLKAGEPANSE